MADFLDEGQRYDPFGKDIPSYDDVLRQVQLKERIEADKNHDTSPPQAATAKTQVSQQMEHEPASKKRSRDRRENRHSHAW
jgi:hypothetical protein